jgi:hypothetical protein
MIALARGVWISQRQARTLSNKAFNDVILNSRSITSGGWVRGGGGAHERSGALHAPVMSRMGQALNKLPPVCLRVQPTSIRCCVTSEWAAGQMGHQLSWCWWSLS